MSAAAREARICVVGALIGFALGVAGFTLTIVNVATRPDPTPVTQEVHP